MLFQARGELDEAKRAAALSRDGDDGARRGRADPADVQRLHRRALRQGDGLGAGPEHRRCPTSAAPIRVWLAAKAADDGRAPPLSRGAAPLAAASRRVALKMIAQRIALGVLLLWAVSVLIFAGTQILPGDVATAMLGQRRRRRRSPISAPSSASISRPSSAISNGSAARCRAISARAIRTARTSRRTSAGGSATRCSSPPPRPSSRCRSPSCSACWRCATATPSSTASSPSRRSRPSRCRSSSPAIC